MEFAKGVPRCSPLIESCASALTALSLWIIILLDASSELLADVSLGLELSKEPINVDLLVVIGDRKVLGLSGEPSVIVRKVLVVRSKPRVLNRNGLKLLHELGNALGANIRNVGADAVVPAVTDGIDLIFVTFRKVMVVGRVAGILLRLLSKYSHPALEIVDVFLQTSILQKAIVESIIPIHHHHRLEPDNLVLLLHDLIQLGLGIGYVVGRCSQWAILGLIVGWRD